MEAPEKFYVHVKGGKVLDTWNDEWIGVHDIEYIRKDAFIKEAENWLSLNMQMLMNVLDVEYDTHDTDIKDFIADFKRYAEEQ